MTHRRQLDFIRCLAITSVLLYHFYPQNFPLGYFGVDLFFILSGYLIIPKISNALKENRFSIRDFLYQRMIRLYPALYFALISSSIYSYFILLPDAFLDYAQSLIATILLGSNNLFYLEAGDYFANNTKLKPLSHMWSLSLEEQFYLLLALLGFILSKFKSLLNLILIILALLSFFFYNFDGVSSTAKFYLLPFRLWEFVLGFLLYKCYFGKINVNSKYSYLNIPIVALFLFLITPHENSNTLQYAPILLCCTLLFFINENDSKFYKICSHFSKLAYPLYIWHQILLSGAANHPDFASMDKELLLIMSLLLSFGTHVFIEKPFHSHSMRDKQLSLFNIYILVSVILISFGLLVISHKGMSQRFPSISVQLDEIRVLKGSYHRDYQRFIPVSENGKIIFPENNKKNVIIIGDSWGFDIGNGLALTNEYNVAFPDKVSHKCIEILGDKKKFKAIPSKTSNDSCAQNIGLFKNIPDNTDFIIISNSQYELNQYSEQVSQIAINDIMDSLTNVDLELSVVIVKGRPVWKASGMSLAAGYSNLDNDSDFLSTFLFYSPNQMVNVNNYYKKYFSNHKVDIFFPYDTFCENDRCKLFDDSNNVLYFDTNHLTLAGAILVGEGLSKFLIELDGKSE